ncbi:MAG: hypothetical protein LBJ25_05875 [Candidatus Margulisbacteria bacterium]|jgi:hypothetical protein|nr:hypothetical protein [Candidatus Margulisiibacteriota bacterium]
MVNTNFSVNAAGNLAQYNLVTNTEKTKDTITVEDITVMVKLGQFNKIRSLIQELKNGSRSDKRVAQKIAAFAEFYKKELDKVYPVEFHDVLNNNRDNIVPAHIYEQFADILDKYNIISYNRPTADINNPASHNFVDHNKILSESILTEDGQPRQQDFINHARNINITEVDELIRRRDFATLNSLVQDLRGISGKLSGNNRISVEKGIQRIQNEISEYSLLDFAYSSATYDLIRHRDFAKINSLIQDLRKIGGDNQISAEKAIRRVQNEISEFAYSWELDRQFFQGSKSEALRNNGNIWHPRTGELGSESKAEEMAEFFESKGDNDISTKIREQIKKVTDKRTNALLSGRRDPVPFKSFNLTPEFESLRKILQDKSDLPLDIQKEIENLLQERFSSQGD